MSVRRRCLSVQSTDRLVGANLTLVVECQCDADSCRRDGDRMILSMTTADGISTVDWDAVNQLTLHIVNATSIDERATARSRLFAFLDQLE